MVKHIRYFLLGTGLICAILVFGGSCAEVGADYPDGFQAVQGDSQKSEDGVGTDLPDVPIDDVGVGDDLVETDTPSPEVGEEDVESPLDSTEVSEEDSQDPDADDAGPVDDIPDCDDENPCTEDFWNGEECINNYIYGVCCLSNAMCDDGNDCTDDVCIEEMCTHEPSCCEQDSECDDGDDLCTLDSCEAGNCVLKPSSAETCCETELFEHAFDDDSLGGVILKNDDNEVGWHLSTEFPAKSPPGVLRYGSLTSNTFDNGITHFGTAELPAIAVPPAVESWFTYDLFLGIEYGYAGDMLELRLSVAGGAQNLVVWNKSKAYVYNGWWSHKVDITAFAGKTIKLTFFFDTLDEEENTGLGVLIDNMHVYSNCQPRVCAFDSDCNDKLGATVDICANGVCVYKPNSKYCASSKDCDDGEPCTANICSQNACYYSVMSNCCLSNSECSDGILCTLDDCVGAYSNHGGYCQHIEITDCCIVNSECNDGNPCTVDSCPVPGQACAHLEIAGCCNMHEDCDDGDPCSEDLCVSGNCQYDPICCAADADCDDSDPLCTAESCVDGLCKVTFIDKPGCCKKGVIFKNFGGGSLQGFQLESDSNQGDGVAWMGVLSPSFSQPGALHYGSANGTYATGMSHSASILSSAFVLPSTTISHLSFWLYLDNEWSNGQGSKEWDHLTVSAFRVDKADDEIILWDSAGGQPQWWLEEAGTPFAPQWTKIPALDLTPFKGRTVRLRFAFDTLDEDANAFMGVYIDDVKVMSTCGP